jgi:predicted nucleotidyltransferase
VSLAAEVARRLDERRIPYALIGAIAMAARGVPRGTHDSDFLVVDRSVLDAAAWDGLGAEVDARRGDFEDPLAGVVRMHRADEHVDVVVVRGRTWEHDVLARAETLVHEGTPFRVVTTEDLVLLKLDAGGLLDRRDVLQILTSVDPDGAIRRTVEERIGQLPADARRLWNEIATSL